MIEIRLFCRIMRSEETRGESVTAVQFSASSKPTFSLIGTLTPTCKVDLTRPGGLALICRLAGTLPKISHQNSTRSACSNDPPDSHKPDDEAPSAIIRRQWARAFVSDRADAAARRGRFTVNCFRNC